jgi:PAS domain S-box-containing protein
VIFAAWYGGFGPGLIAAVLSALAADFFLMPPVYSLTLSNPAHVAAVLFFLLMGFLISLICERLQRIEHAEQETRAKLAAVVESTEDAIISKSEDGTILTWNRGAERMYGYSAREAVGRNISIIVPQEQAGELAEMMGRLREGAPAQYCETLRRRKDGKLIDASISITPIKDAEGQTLAYATTTRDISRIARKPSTRSNCWFVSRPWWLTWGNWRFGERTTFLTKLSLL